MRGGTAAHCQIILKPSIDSYKRIVDGFFFLWYNVYINKEKGRIMDIVYAKSLNGLDEFPAWSGGKHWLDEFVKHPLALTYLEDYLEDLYDGGATFTDTDINDFLWFNAFDMLVEEGFVDEDMHWKDEEEWIG